MKWSFSVLIHKSVENYMDRQAYLWSDLDLRLVSFYKSNYIAEKMDAKLNKKAWHKTVQHQKSQ